MIRLAVAYASGLVFALGLGFGELTRPERIQGALDVFGTWDPTLFIVFAVGVAIYYAAYRAVRGRPQALLGGRLAIPARTELDARLIGGSALFGAGWGLGGFCPGPIVTSLAGGHLAPWVVLGGLLVGTVLGERISGRLARTTSAPAPAPA